MATGRLASILPTDTTPVTIFTCPANRRYVATIRCCNAQSTTKRVNIWLAAGNPTDADYIEYQTPIVGNGILEDSGLLLGEGDTITVQAVDIGPNFVLFGLEEIV